MDDLGDALEPLRETAVPGTYVFAIVVIFAEFFVLLATKKPFSHRGGFASLVSGGGSFGLLFLADRAFYAALFSASYEHRLTTLDLSASVWLGAFLLYDFAFYLGHRAGHEVRLLWCFHSVHHTADEMRLSSAVRGSFLDFVYLPWFFAWIPLLGVHPSMLLVVESFARMWGIATHVSPHLVGKLGILDRLLVTPSVHRVHHGKEIRYLDKNYGEVLLLWDWLFGSHEPEKEEPTYGLRKASDANGLVAIQFAPWRDLWRDLRRAPDWGTRLRYLFDAPGYDHEGPDERVKALHR